MQRTFSRQQVSALEYDAWLGEFDPAKTPQRELRRQMGSVVLSFEDYSLQPLAACGDPATQKFVRNLHHEWPHAFYYLSLSGEHLKAYVFCLLSNVAVEKEAGGRIRVVGYNKDELFQLIGNGVLAMENTCILAGAGPSEYRNRSRLLLKHFGFLK